MGERLENPAEEIKRLRRCINDLVGVLALSATWGGCEPSQILRTVLDVVLGMVNLDLVYMRLEDPVGESPMVEMAWIAQLRSATVEPLEIRELLNQNLGSDSQKWPPLARVRIAGGDLSIAPFRLGLQGEIGVIVAGCQRLEFPGQTERLILSVAANQTAIWLQEARMLSEQRRIAKELDQRVAQRTSDLAAANQELKKEVAERKRVEDALRVRERDSRLIVDSIPALIALMTPAGEVDFVNRQVLEYFGRTLDEMKNWGSSDAVHPDDLPLAIKSFGKSIATGDPYEIEHRLRRFDGVYRWFQARGLPFRDADGRIIRWHVLLTDIDGRKRAEEVLHASERRLRLIFDGLPTLVTTMSPDGELENANRHVLEYFGATLEQLKVLPSASTLHPDDRSAALAAWGKSIESGRQFVFEGRQRRADGDYRWFHMHGFPLRDTKESIVLWYLVQNDIDDLKRAEGLLADEKLLLELVAGGHPMSAILNALCRLVDGSASGCYCSAVLVDPTNTRIEHGAAPSLPANFINSIVGQAVNVDSGPCAMAAFLNEQVFSADLATETRWAEKTWWPIALAHGLRACWATPITSTAGKVLGSFAIYYDEPRTPTPQDQVRVDKFKHVARIALERALGDAALRQSEARKAAILDSALDCIVTIDHEGRITEFNPAAERTFGYLRAEVMGKQLGDVIVPKSLRQKHRQGFARYLATGEGHVLGKRMEMSAVRADGTEFPVELAITRIPLDGPPSFTGYLRDITEQKKNENALRQAHAQVARSEERWRSVFENSAIGVALTDLSGRFFATNPAYQKMLGYTKEELQQLTFLEITHEEDLEPSRTLVEELLTGKRQQFQIEKQYRRKDGGLVWVRNSVSVVPGTEQEPRFIMALSEDITERKQSEASFRAIVETTPECVKVLARDGTVLRVNSAGLAMAGVPSAAIVLGQSFYNFLAPEHRERYREFNEMICSGQKGFLEFDIITMRGERRHMETHAAAMRNNDGSVVQLGVSRDITPRKQAEERIRRSEAYLAEAQKLSHTGSFGWSVAADEHFWSDETFRIFEHDISSKITLKMVLERIHPEDVSRVKQVIERATHDGKDWEIEYRLLTPSGAVKNVHVVAHAVVGKSGDREFVGAVMDVTATRRAEEALRRAQADLAHVSRVTTLGEFAASIAHEVNQPLTGVVNNANACLGLLLEPAPDLQEVRDALAEIVDDADRASAVVARVRQLARKAPADRTHLDIKDVITDVLVLARYESTNRRVTILTELPERLPTVLGDRVQLQQVLLNLVVNGMDAMNTIEEPKRLLVISAQCDMKNPSSECLVSVRDAGIGFKHDERDKFFEAFYTTKPGGMGMGLAISRSIIEAHGGRLWAEPNQGAGATVLFCLPAAGSTTL